MEATIYNQNGKDAGKVTLPEAIFDTKWNSDLVHQVVTAMQANARTNVAHTKDRSEVRGGGKKPWKQKGTGRARHGSNRSPIWVGGGVTFGPRNDKDYSQKINKKMRAKALYTVLSQKLRHGEVLFVDSIEFDEIKTNKAKDTMAVFASIKGFEGLNTKKRNSLLLTTLVKDENVYKSFSNFNNVALDEIRNINPVELLKYKYVVITQPKESISFLESKMAKTTKKISASPEVKEAKSVEKKPKPTKTKTTKGSSPDTSKEVISKVPAKKATEKKATVKKVVKKDSK